MIKLKVKKYCQACNHFESEVRSISYTGLEAETNTTFVVTCAFADKCDYLIEFLKNQEAKNDSNRNA